jgi:hypothetical protein
MVTRFQRFTFESARPLHREEVARPMEETMSPAASAADGLPTTQTAAIDFRNSRRCIALVFVFYPTKTLSD